MMRNKLNSSSNPQINRIQAMAQIAQLLLAEQIYPDCLTDQPLFEQLYDHQIITKEEREAVHIILRQSQACDQKVNQKGSESNEQ